MKITPVKDYKAPKYAAGIAALVAITASSAGCVQNSGAAMTYNTTEPAYTDTELAGAAETWEDTTAAASNLNNKPDSTCTGTGCDTTKPVTTEDTQLEGGVAVPCETTAVTGLGSIFSVAANVIKNIFTEEDPKLEGDVPMYTDVTELDGDVAVTEEEITELAGDVEVPEEDCRGYEYAKDNLETIRSGFPTAELLPQYETYEVEYPTETEGTIWFDCYYKIGDGDDPVYVSFVKRNTFDESYLIDDERITNLDGGFYYVTADGTKVLILQINAYDVDLGTRNIEKLVKDIKAKGINI